MEQKENRLARESSPYLLQHKNNPVDWYPWGAEAFERAAKEDKPVFLSIGYATCYWCHVMEKNSFETDEVAAVLNKNFISIKVDREERPDVDQIYMDAVVGLNGHGGWPMSVFLTPDKKPFWGGTYFPRPQFINVLTQLSEAWTSERSSVLASASNITETLRGRRIDGDAVPVTEESLIQAATAFKRTFDPEHGGFGKAPKFPPSQQIRSLLRFYTRTKDEELLKIASTTLLKMAYGGIFDHIEGGFHRYATDVAWVIPHFEKMLYDNALLVPAYLEAYQVTGDERFSGIARDTLNYLASRMKDSLGGFYSAEDAGEVDKEGEFYVWSYEELEKKLPEKDLKALSAAFSISAEGNFEGNNILTLNPEVLWREKDASLREPLATLKTLRDKRERPLLDDKILTSWNGLALTAFSHGAVVLQDPLYKETAVRLAAFIKSSLVVDGNLMHRFRNGEVGIGAFLEDYTYLIEGLITLYRATFDESYLTWARELQNEQDKHLWDEAEGAYDFSAAPDVLYRKKEIIDGATPSGNSVAIGNLLFLADAFGEEAYRERAQKILAHISVGLRQYPSAFSKALQSVATVNGPLEELVICSSDRAWEAELSKVFRPDLRIYASTNPKSSLLPIVNVREVQGEKTLFYLCEGHACQLPETSLKAVLKKLT